jgi:regulatory protein
MQPVTPRKPRPLDEAGLLDYAARLLAGRAQSAGEMREKLRRRAARAADVDTALAKLKELGYLNDRQFAESFASGRVENEGLGRARVLRDLRQRHVAPAVAERAVKQAYGDKDETILIEAFLARRYRGKDLRALLGDAGQVAAAYRRLRYAGFSGGASIGVLKRYAAEGAPLDALADAPEPEEEPE